MNLSAVDKKKSAAAATALVLITVSAAFMILPQDTEGYTVDEAVEKAPSLDGETVTVRGEAAKGRAICTQMACPEENPCCNTCSAQVKLEEESSITLRGEDIGCSGNNCQVNCKPETGKTYLVKGTLENGKKASINVSNYTEVR